MRTGFCLLVMGLALLGISCGLTSETAYVPEDALEATQNWLVDFSHTNLEYVDQAKSAYAYAADGEVCRAGWKFDDIVQDARDRDGSRMPVASYNAGVLYMVASWDRRHCLSDRRIDVDPIDRLEYAMEHMPDRSLDDAIHMLLGNAYHNEWDKINRRDGRRNEIREKSRAHYCMAAALDPFYTEQVEERFSDADWKPCPDASEEDSAQETDG